ncbi:MAG: 4Fe-4S dicluster domain-containing protein [Chloroflexota bacterium]
MPYVICEPCIGVKDTACTDVCPVDCIHPTRDEDGFEASDQLFINPDECIECGACSSVCPVEAIYRDEEVPDKWQSFIQKNASYYQ